MPEPIATPSSQDQFVTIVCEIFQTSRMAALEVYTKVTSFVTSTTSLSRLPAGDDFEDLTERVRDRLVGMDLRSFGRQVAIPLFGFAVAAALVALEVPALAAALIGALVSLILWLGGIRTTLAQIRATLDGVFAEIKAKTDQLGI